MTDSMEAMDVLVSPRQDVTYTGWDGRHTQKVESSFTEELVTPAMVATISTLGYLCIMLFMILSVFASVLDRVLRRKNTDRFRYKIDNLITGIDLDTAID